MEDNLEKINITIEDTNEARNLFGINDVYLKRIEEQLNVSIVTRGEEIQVTGAQTELVEPIIEGLLSVIKKGLDISERDVLYAIKLAKEGKMNQFETLFEDEIKKNYQGKSIRVKTLGQKHYVEAINYHDLVFGIGPAGTGKTYLYVVNVVSALKKVHIRRISFNSI